MAEGERQPPPDSSEETPPTTQNFIIPKKEIHTVPDMGKWKRSQAYADYIGFILTLNEGVKGKKLTFDYKVSIVFKVFDRYLEVMRKLQKTYRMEPAGSQGVWGLDDFQFLPFIWGSSQLIDHPHLEPRHFVDEKAVSENHKDYMFLQCILFITEMKTGPFAEHSNQLWNISAVPSWSKVNQGLIRMYKAECLEKFPVIQHFKFGSLLPIHPVTSG